MVGVLGNAAMAGGGGGGRVNTSDFGHAEILTSWGSFAFAGGGGGQWLQSWWKPFKELSQGPTSACSFSGHVAGSPVNPGSSISCIMDSSQYGAVFKPTRAERLSQVGQDKAEALCTQVIFFCQLAPLRGVGCTIDAWDCQTCCVFFFQHCVRQKRTWFSSNIS